MGSIVLGIIVAACAGQPAEPPAAPGRQRRQLRLRPMERLRPASADAPAAALPHLLQLRAPS